LVSAPLFQERSTAFCHVVSSLGLKFRNPSCLRNPHKIEILENVISENSTQHICAYTHVRVSIRQRDVFLIEITLTQDRRHTSWLLIKLTLVLISLDSSSVTSCYRGSRNVLLLGNMKLSLKLFDDGVIKYLKHLDIVHHPSCLYTSHTVVLFWKLVLFPFSSGEDMKKSLPCLGPI
jgi:hypothetical protein